MIFTKLILENFGLFRGWHEFNLQPISSDGINKPIILFGGKNGAGKTTILEAVRLCLYGSGFRGNRLTKKEYERYLQGRIHRRREAPLSSAMVGLDFKHAHLGKTDVYSVRRSWQWHDPHVIETLEISLNNEPFPDLEADQWQDFLRELIPPGLSQLFFFDGERIQNLAEDRPNSGLLLDSLKSLLGLDLVERLQADLRIHSTRQMKEAGADETVKKIAELQEQQKVLDMQLDALNQNRAQTQSQIDYVRGEIERQEQKITSEGGSFSKKREELKMAATKLDSEIIAIEERLRDLCSGLLPFAIVPNLCQSLKSHLLLEEEYFQWEAAQQILEDKLQRVEDEIHSGSLLEGLQFSDTTTGELSARISKVLRALLEPPEKFQKFSLLHQLSSLEQRKLIGWIDQSLEDVPQQLKTLTGALERLTRERQKIENALSHAPSDDILHPLVVRLNELHQQSGQLHQQIQHIDNDIHQIEFHLKGISSKLQAQYDLQAKKQGMSSSLELAGKVQNVLDDYFVKLKEEKTKVLSDTLTECFSGLSWKGNLIEKVKVSPGDFSILLYEHGSLVVPKEQLSAGEKQIYAIAMLWALAKTSGRQLPFIIDTPLGRLDSDHRRSLIMNFFPKTGHQVIVLSTDTEIDKTYFKMLQPCLARSYHLTFDKEMGMTTVSDGYFWLEEKAREVMSNEL